MLLVQVILFVFLVFLLYYYLVQAASQLVQVELYYKTIYVQVVIALAQHVKVVLQIVQVAHQEKLFN